MEIFAKRLKELREEKGLTIYELAKEIGYSHAAVSRWESRLRIPNLEAIIALAKFFNVTADYLCGLED